MITQKINLNLIPNGVMPRVNVSQYDYGSRTLEITLYNGSTLFEIPSGAQIVMQGTKKDNRGFQYVDLDYSGSVVTADITQQMTVFEDEVQVELVIITGSDDNKQQLATANFILNVEQAALKDDIVVSETDIPAIQTLPEAMAEVNYAVELLEQVVPSIEGSVEESEAWARGTKDNVPVTSEDAQYHNNSKYYAEQASGSAGSAGTNALNAEAFGAGTRNGTDVTSGDAAYQNNAKYYAGQAGNNASAASGSATSASASAEDAEAYGIGKRGGVDVESGDVAYHNNSKYYAGLASNSANNAGTNAETAEAYAKGTRSGSAISSDDPAYNNNSKYYSEQASGYANTASDYVTSASAQSDQAQAWATGEIDGTPVASDKPQYHNSAKYWADQASQAAGGGVTSFNGRTGSVSPADGDYDITQIAPTFGATEGQVVVVDSNGDFTVDDAPSSGHTIKDDSTTFTQRSNLQFTGNVSVSDDSTNNATVVEVTDSGHEIIDSSDTSMTQRTGLQFATGFSVTDDSANDRTVVETFSGSYNDLTDVPTSTVKTATDTFSTVNGGLLSKCEVELSPAQDLHGYDKPWAGGAGKNLLPMTIDNLKAINTGGTWSGNSYTQNDITFIIQADDDGNVTGIKINGTANANTFFSLVSYSTYNGNYILSGCPNGGSTSTYWLRMRSSTSGDFNDTGNSVAFNPQSDRNYVCEIVVISGTTVDNVTFYPMMRLATETDASFAPYSNICSISGHTESKVKRVGTNLFDPDHAQIVTGLGINANGYFSRNDQCLIVFPVKQNTTYSASLIKSNDGSRYYTLANEYPTDTTSQHTSRVQFADDEVAGTRVGFTVNTSTYKYLVIGKFGTSDPQDLLSDVMIEIGDAQSPFEPYSERIYTINLGGTYYGGTVDFVSGKLTEDGTASDLITLNGNWSGTPSNYFYTYLGTGTWSKVVGSDIFEIGSEYNVVTGHSKKNIMAYNANSGNLMVYAPDYADAATFKTAVENYHAMMKLATPLEIDLTPTQIDALVGDNNLFAPLDFQEINGVEYKDIFSWQDVKKAIAYKEGLEIVSFANGTDAQIKAMLDAYYNDEISWEQMGWNIGDTRLMHFNEMDAPSPQASGSKWAAQDIVCVITGHDHHDLATPINGHTKACISVDTRECMNNGSGNDGVNGIYVNGDAEVDETFTKWSELYVRTYLNSVVLNAIPSGDFKSAIKPIKHYCHTDYNTADAELVVDTLYLRSYPEMRGTEEYPSYVPTSPVEGTQLPYYKTSSNRIKYGNNNGELGEIWLYWLSSPATLMGPGYQRLYISTNGGTGYRSGRAAAGLVVSFDM